MRASVPGEHKTVQASILAYAQEIDCATSPRALKRIGQRGLKLAPTRTLTAADTQNGLH